MAAEADMTLQVILVLSEPAAACPSQLIYREYHYLAKDHYEIMMQWCSLDDLLKNSAVDKTSFWAWEKFIWGMSESGTQK